MKKLILSSFICLMTFQTFAQLFVTDANDGQITITPKGVTSGLTAAPGGSPSKDPSNTAFGYYPFGFLTTGVYNTAMGLSALYSVNTGVHNTAIGAKTLFSTANGNYNTAVGTSAMEKNISGTYNVAIGSGALFNNVSKRMNTAVGYNAMYYANNRDEFILSETYNTAVGFEALRGTVTPVNNTGMYNTAVGALSLRDNANGESNSAFGEGALVFNVTGKENTAIGRMALMSNIHGNYNTAVGYNALSLIAGYTTATSGHNNTAIGREAGNLISSGSDNIVIGANAQVPNDTADGQIQMGIDAATITVARIRVAWTVTSDRRYKENIQDIPLGISFIKALRPVSYHRIGNKNNDIEMGLIAQELEAALQKAGSKDLGIIHKDAKGYYSVRYNDLLPPMIKAMQEQQDMIEQLQKENTQLKAENKNFEARLTNIETMLTNRVKPDNSISEDKR